MSDKYRLLLGNCLDRLKELPDSSIDSIVTDPPYGLSFMGKKWDYDVPAQEIWEECLRVLKPGGHLLAFAGTRTQHRMAIRIEDAGFEIRDMIAWVYGSGFPKSLDVSKAIDKAAGAERKVLETKVSKSGGMAHIMKTNSDQGYRPNDYYEESGNIIEVTEPATDDAKKWDGWGTALKPALEPITVARKPLIGTVAENVLAYGTGAINVDGCRVATDDRVQSSASEGVAFGCNYEAGTGRKYRDNYAGRWPANLIHDGSDEVAGLLNDAARFFYCAKASKSDRDEGLDGFEAKDVAQNYGLKISTDNRDGRKQDNRTNTARANNHPTVKPTELMRYLCRLVTPPNGIVLDPFMGSGSIGKAAMLEGFQFIGVELDENYYDIAKARIEHALEKRGFL